MSFTNVLKPRLTTPALMAVLVFATGPPAHAVPPSDQSTAQLRQRVTLRLPSMSRISSATKHFFSRAIKHFFLTPRPHALDPGVQKFREHIRTDRAFFVREQQLEGPEKRARGEIDGMLERLVGYEKPTKAPPLIKGLIKILPRGARKLRSFGLDPVNSAEFVDAVFAKQKLGLLSDGSLNRLAERIGDSLAEHCSDPRVARERLVEISSLVHTLDGLKKRELGHGAFDAKRTPQRRALAIRNSLAAVVRLAEDARFDAFEQLPSLGQAFNRVIEGLQVAPLAIERTALKAAMRDVHQYMRDHVGTTQTENMAVALP